MKKLFLLLFVSMGYFFSSYGQEKLTFSKVIEVKDVDLYEIGYQLTIEILKRFCKWMTKTLVLL